VTSAMRSMSDIGPAVLVLDDMERANADTLHTLVDLAMSEVGRVLIVATFRTTSDDDDDYQGLREQILRATGVETIEVGPLQEADIGSVTDQQIDDHEVRRNVKSRFVLDAVGGLAGDVV